MVEPVSFDEMIWFFVNEDNSQIFPLYSDAEQLPSENSALARIHQKRAEYNERSILVIDGAD